MKKIICLTFLSLLLQGCVSGKNQMQEIVSKVYIGMPLSEFNKIIPKKRLIIMRKDVTVYKVERQVWYDSDGSNADFKYFYFVDNLLSHLDEGERAVDYRIQIDKN
jgi:hypothetical protein